MYSGDYRIEAFSSDSDSLLVNLSSVATGQPSFDSFTLEVNGYLSQPIPFDASAAEVAMQVRGLFGPECPDGLGVQVGTKKFLY